MRKPSSMQIVKLILFASPCYWILVLMLIALAIWKVGFSEPDLVPLACVSIAMIVAAILLVKKYYWISLPMILLGVYVFFALKNDQHFGDVFQLYGAYLIIHYLVCGIYVFRHGRKSRE